MPLFPIYLINLLHTTIPHNYNPDITILMVSANGQK
jgi:hypothetical protein